MSQNIQKFENKLRKIREFSPSPQTRVIPVTARAGAEEGANASSASGKRLGARGCYTYRLHDHLFRNSRRIADSRILGGFVNSDLSSQGSSRRGACMAVDVI